jgi:hypothetical protein
MECQSDKCLAGPPSALAFAPWNLSLLPTISTKKKNCLISFLFNDELICGDYGVCVRQQIIVALSIAIFPLSSNGFKFWRMALSQSATKRRKKIVVCKS